MTPELAMCDDEFCESCGPVPATLDAVPASSVSYKRRDKVKHTRLQINGTTRMCTSMKPNNKYSIGRPNNSSTKGTE